jgi:hypothetical protein
MSPVLWIMLGLIVGAGVSWLLAQARQRELLAASASEASKASTALQVELSATKERASLRIPADGGQGFQINVDTDSSATWTEFRRDGGQFLE